MPMVTIIGRGHSGTRVISHTLSASGVFMGSPLNDFGDLLPPEDMYAACRLFGQYVQWKGGVEWDWSLAQAMDIPPEFTGLIHRYLSSVEQSSAGLKGWKIPETTLVFPWMASLFAEIKYIYWIRNPRDCILGGHLTDDLNDFGISYPATEDERLRRAISWKYQYDLVKAMPKPKNWLEVRFEDFILDQEATLQRIEEFIGISLVKIPVRPEALDRWKGDPSTTYYDFLGPAMRQYGYEAPAAAPPKSPELNA